MLGAGGRSGGTVKVHLEISRFPRNRGNRRPDSREFHLRRCLAFFPPLSFPFAIYLERISRLGIIWTRNDRATASLSRLAFFRLSDRVININCIARDWYTWMEFGRKTSEKSCFHRACATIISIRFHRSLFSFLAGKSIPEGRLLCRSYLRWTSNQLESVDISLSFFFLLYFWTPYRLIFANFYLPPNTSLRILSIRWKKGDSFFIHLEVASGEENVDSRISNFLSSFRNISLVFFQ